MNKIMRLIEAEALLLVTLDQVRELRRGLTAAEEDEVEAAIEYAQSIIKESRNEVRA